MKILVIEDEPKISAMIQMLMENEGYDCLVADNGQQGFESFKFHRPDLVILDWNLPGMNGIDVCNRIRQSSAVAPHIDPYILMLTARQNPEDRVDGFSSGADDYMSKPFAPKELVVRVRALLRRELRHLPEHKASSLIETPHLRINTESFTVSIRSLVDCEFSPLKERLRLNEFKLLATLAQHPSRVYSRDELLSAVWTDDFNGSDRTVDAYIKQLRAKLKVSETDPFDRFIKTKIGLGYFFEDTHD